MQGYRNSLRRCVWLVLTLFGLSTLLLPAAQAGMISVQQQQLAGELRNQQQAQVQAFLQRDEVRSKLVEWGVDPAQAEARVQRLSDAELVKAARLTDQPAGSGVVGAIVLIFVVLLITDILGLTDIFTFVRKR